MKLLKESRGFTPKIEQDMLRAIALVFPEDSNLKGTYADMIIGKKIKERWSRFVMKRYRSKFIVNYLIQDHQYFNTIDTAKIRVWVEQFIISMDVAREEFNQTRASFFWGIHVITRQERSKHWPPKNKSNKQIQKDSKKLKESFFCNEIRISLLEQTLRLSIAADFMNVWAKRRRYISYDTEQTIGYSDGKPTSIIRFDIDYSTSSAHGYPIAASEIRKSHKLVTATEMEVEVHIEGRTDSKNHFLDYEILDRGSAQGQS
jgi:hypothetical protein